MIQDIKKSLELNGNATQTPITRVGEILITICAAFMCIFIIPMLWCIPMIIRNEKRRKGELPITILHTVIAFLFFGFIPGILLVLGGDIVSD